MFKILSELFLAFFKVGLLSFGGGYTLIPLIEQQVVDVYGWLSPDEYAKILGASQMIPGAISIKFATYVGYKEAGVLGIIVSILGSLIVPILLIVLLFGLLTKGSTFKYGNKILLGVKGATWGLVVGFGLQMMKGVQNDVKLIALGVLATVLTVVFGLSPAVVILVGGALGFLFL
ncbi:MAG TPA: chromate transporter [Clostridiales bacterium UBA8960]|jgi:chromate transporter|nr:chromate transporter [Clostridiales bacterium UBA8960]